MGLGLYVPNSGFAQGSSMTFYGSLFTHDFLGGGSLTMNFDRAFAGEALNCPPPAGAGCTTCLDCANQACNCPGGQPCASASGTCGNCAVDSDCCQPLRCVRGDGSACNGASSCSCQFTSF
jgi:hypothetical protein